MQKFKNEAKWKTEKTSTNLLSWLSKEDNDQQQSGEIRRIIEK